MMNDIMALEALIENEEFIEPISEQEPLLEEISAMEIEDHYLIDPEAIEIQDAVREISELSPERPLDHYDGENSLFEIQNAIYRQKL